MVCARRLANLETFPTEACDCLTRWYPLSDDPDAGERPVRSADGTTPNHVASHSVVAPGTHLHTDRIPSPSSPSSRFERRISEEGSELAQRREFEGFAAVVVANDRSVVVGWSEQW